MNTLTFYLGFSLSLLLLNVNGKSSAVHDNLQTETTTTNGNLPITNALMNEGIEIRPRENTIDHPELQDCETQEINRDEYSLLDNGDAYITAYDKILSRTMFQINGEKLVMCRLNDLSVVRDKAKRDTFPNCQKWIYEKDEFKLLPNGSVLLYAEILQIGSYELKGDQLLICIDEDYDNDTDNLTNNDI